MNRDRTANVAASIRGKLLNIIRQSGEPPNILWSRYACERLLYRLSISPFASDFVLKGAMLFAAWSGEAHRPTVDLDLLGYGEDSAERMEDVFRQVCRIDFHGDGLAFDADSIRVTPIREELEYKGQRVNLVAYLLKARIPVQVDIGFGDVVTPQAQMIDYPTMLQLPSPRICAYPRETVVAEKFQAMVGLGMLNSRMKDFYDLYMLSARFAFHGPLLAGAIKATFTRRRTQIPFSVPLALTNEFGNDATKNTQWKAFVRKGNIGSTAPGFLDVLLQLREFLLPAMLAAADGRTCPRQWKPSGPWTA
jgi:hypothetical protein